MRQLVTKRLEREQAEAEERARLEQEMREAGEATGVDTTERAAGGVAQGIYDEDLQAFQHQTGHASSIGDLDELILQQEGGMKQIFGGAFRREYSILAADGSAIGTVQQRENEMLQNATNRSLFELPDLHFDVMEGLTGERFVFKRSEGLARQRIGVFDERGMMFATTDWKFHLVWRKYEVCSTRDGSKLLVQNQLLHPFTLSILDVMEENVGQIERGFSGLGGLLSGGNKMRIRIRSGEANPGLRWGLLAAALLTDLAQEDDKSRGNSLIKF